MVRSEITPSPTAAAVAVSAPVSQTPRAASTVRSTGADSAKSAADKALEAAGTGQAAGTAGDTGVTRGSANQIPNKVYLGSTYTAGQDAHDRRSGAIQNRADVTLAEGYQAFWNWEDGYRNAMAMAMYKAGMISDASNIQLAYGAWQDAVDVTARYNAAGRKDLTPEQVLGMQYAVAGVKVGSQKRTQTSTSYNVPSALDAEAGIKGIFADAVGRDPTDSELKKYTSLMTGLARSQPGRSTTTYDAAGNASTSSTDGIGAPGLGQAVKNKVQGTSEYGAYQAATTYYNAAIQALQAPI
jgi:hypothetical protein